MPKRDLGMQSLFRCKMLEALQDSTLATVSMELLLTSLSITTS